MFVLWYRIVHNPMAWSLMLIFWSPGIDPPGPPGEPQVEEIGSDFVSLTWSKPTDDGGGRILGYMIEKKEVSSDNWVKINSVPSPANVFNVSNLIEDREYDFRIKAVNEAGESKAVSTSRKVKIRNPNGTSQVYLSLHARHTCGAWWLIGWFVTGLNPTLAPPRRGLEEVLHSQLPVVLRRETPTQYPCCVWSTSE